MDLILKFKGRFPTIGEYNNRKQESPWAAHSLKRKFQSIVLGNVLSKGHFWYETPIIISCRFYEKNRKREFNSIASFVHMITQDALVEAKVIRGAGWDYIAGFHDEFFVDHINPRVEIRIFEAQKEQP